VNRNVGGSMKIHKAGTDWECWKFDLRENMRTRMLLDEAKTIVNIR